MNRRGRAAADPVPPAVSTVYMPRASPGNGSRTTEPVGLQPVDEPGQAGPRQQHPIGELGHPQPAVGRLDQLQQHVVPGERQAGLRGQVALEPADDLACARRNDRQTAMRQSEGRNGALAVGMPRHPRWSPARTCRVPSVTLRTIDVCPSRALTRFTPPLPRSSTPRSASRSPSSAWSSRWTSRPDGSVRVRCSADRRRLPDEGAADRGTSPPRSPAFDGVTGVGVHLGVMNDAQRGELRQKLRGDAPANEIPFAQPGSRTRVYAVASGKGGVGKSSVTVNLAVALAGAACRSACSTPTSTASRCPRMLGVTGKPTQVDQMIMPPIAHDVKVISIGMFTPGNTAVVWRGPMLHRALQQFLADVFWGDLDVLLMDLPPGTGDIAISVAQLVPVGRAAGRHHPAARRARGGRARRVDRAADASADRRRRREHELARAARRLPAWSCSASAAARRWPTRSPPCTGTRVPLLGQIPIDQRVREGGDDGAPVVLCQPDSPAAEALRAVADTLAATPAQPRRPLAGPGASRA